MPIKVAFINFGIKSNPSCQSLITNDREQNCVLASINHNNFFSSKCTTVFQSRETISKW